MNLSRKSWTYKLLTHEWMGNRSERKIAGGLCLLFWQCVLAVIVTALKMATATAITAGASYLLISFVYVTAALLAGISIMNSHYIIGFTITSIATSAVICSLIGNYINNILHYYKIYMASQSQPKTSSDNVVVQFIKAKHEKICPRVNLID